MADVVIASCGIFEPQRAHVEIVADDATMNITAINAFNLGDRALTIKLALPDGTSNKYNLVPGSRTWTIRSLKLKAVLADDRLSFDGMLGLF